MRLTKKRATQLVRKWQTVLGLKDWNIATRVGTVKGAWGKNDLLPEKRQSLVTIDPRMGAPKETVRHWPWWKANHERTIVHELLHCHLYQLRKRGGYHEEQVIHALSEAFLKLKRRRK